MDKEEKDGEGWGGEGWDIKAAKTSDSQEVERVGLCRNRQGLFGFFLPGLSSPINHIPAPRPRRAASS